MGLLQWPITPNNGKSSPILLDWNKTFGGDGRTTFALPDLRGKVVIHAGQGNGVTPYALGRSGGTEKASPQPDGSTRVQASKGAILATNALTGIQPINIIQPYLALNFIIALQGSFPVRE